MNSTLKNIHLECYGKNDACRRWLREICTGITVTTSTLMITVRICTTFRKRKRRRKKKIDTDVSIAKLKVIHRVTRNRNFGLVLVERVVTVSSLKYGTVKPDYIEPSYIKLSLILNNFCAP